MKRKQKIIIGLAISLITLINVNAAFANYNWKDYFSFEQITALKKDTNQSVLNKLKSDPDWKSVISGRNIKNGSISTDKIASIDGLKINPDFGSQNITTTGNYEIGGSTVLKSDASLRNTFVGFGAGGANTTGDSNTFIGDSSGYFNTTGSSNTFLGRRSGVSNTSGESNTFIGMASGFSNIDGQGNVFIGNQAGANETGSNKLYIANGVTTNSTSLIYGEFNTTPANQILSLGGGGNVGIGTTSPGSALDVKGTFRLSGATSGYVGLTPADTAGSTTYTLPSADGINGQSLTTNGSGTLSWSSPSITSTNITDGSIVNADISDSAAIDYSKLNLGSNISSTNITDGTIVNADISGSAAIAGSKITPNFVAQHVVTSGIIESTIGGFKFPDGTTQTTAAKTSATLCTASTGATTTCGIFSLCAIARTEDTSSNTYEYGRSCELTDSAGTWTLVSVGEDCKAYCL